MGRWDWCECEWKHPASSWCPGVGLHGVQARGSLKVADVAEGYFYTTECERGRESLAEGDTKRRMVSEGHRRVLWGQEAALTTVGSRCSHLSPLLFCFNSPHGGFTRTSTEGKQGGSEGPGANALRLSDTAASTAGHGTGPTAGPTGTEERAFGLLDVWGTTLGSLWPALCSAQSVPSVSNLSHQLCVSPSFTPLFVLKQNRICWNCAAHTHTRLTLRESSAH